MDGCRGTQRCQSSCGSTVDQCARNFAVEESDDAPWLVESYLCLRAVCIEVFQHPCSLMICHVGRFLWWRYVLPLTDGWPNDVIVPFEEYYESVRDVVSQSHASTRDDYWPKIKRPAYPGWCMVRAWIFGLIWWHRPSRSRYRSYPVRELEFDRGTGYKSVPNRNATSMVVQTDGDINMRDEEV